MNTILDEAVVREKRISPENNTATVSLHFPEQAAIFAGHFPDRPILAGAFQLEICRKLAEELSGIKLAVTEIIQAKFTALILHDDPITLSVSLKQDEEGYLAAATVTMDKQEGKSAMKSRFRLIPAPQPSA